MQTTILKLYLAAQAAKCVLADEDGQDLIEYALVVALIAFAAITGMNSVATSINDSFTAIGARVTSYA